MKREEDGGDDAAVSNRTMVVVCAQLRSRPQTGDVLGDMDVQYAEADDALDGV